MQLQHELSSCQDLLAALEEELAVLRQRLTSATTRTEQLEQELHQAKEELQVHAVQGTLCCVRCVRCCACQLSGRRSCTSKGGAAARNNADVDAVDMQEFVMFVLITR